MTDADMIAALVFLVVLLLWDDERMGAVPTATLFIAMVVIMLGRFVWLEFHASPSEGSRLPPVGDARGGRPHLLRAQAAYRAIRATNRTGGAGGAGVWTTSWVA